MDQFGKSLCDNGTDSMPNIDRRIIFIVVIKFEFFSLETRTNTFEMGIKQFNGNIMTLHRIASFDHAIDISIESYWNRINCKIEQRTFESLNHWYGKKLKFYKKKS